MASKDKTSTIIPGYRIERRIARGGMGSVYLARQESLNRRVAIKVLSGERDADFNQRFINEARGIADLNHSNIVPIYDVGVVAKRPFFSMEYLGGGDLSRQITKGIRPLTAAGIVARLARCLDFVHAHGVIHRDIKPANILFRRDKTPVLTDFGVARWESVDAELTLAGSVIGSPFYVSPELARGEAALDGRTDIYSLGVVFYEMLTSRRPFVGEGVAQILLAHQSKPIPRLPARLAHWQPALDSMLAKDSVDRPASGVEVIELLRAGGGSPVVDRTVANHLPTAILGETALLGGDAEESQPLVGERDQKPTSNSFKELATSIAQWRPPKKWQLPIGVAALLLIVGSAGLIFSGGEDKQEAASVAGTKIPPPDAKLSDVSSGDQPKNIALSEAGEIPQTAATNELSETGADVAVAQAPLDTVDTSLDAGSQLAGTAERVLNTEEDAKIAEEVDAAVAASDDQEPLDSLDSESLADLSFSVDSELANEPEEVDATAEIASTTKTEAATVQISEQQKLLALASDRTKQLRLTSPRGDSAYDYLEQLKKLDPKYPGLSRGYTRIAQRYGVLATRAAEKGEFEDARRYIKRGSAISPRSTALKRAREALHRAEVSQVKARMAAQQRSAQQAEEHRRAAQAAGAPVSGTRENNKKSNPVADWFRQEPSDVFDEEF